MSALRAVLRELIGLFVGDEGLAIGIAAVVAISAALIRGLGVAPMVGGAILFGGLIAVLVGAAWRAGGRR